jgi:ribosomal protein S27AE
MNEKLNLLIRSLLTTAIISALIGGTVKLFGYPFWMWFTVSFIVQFLVSYIFNAYLEYKAAYDMRLIILKEAEMVQKNSINVICASCSKESNVAIRTDEENRFMCGFCGAKNSVYLVAETALITEPIYDAPSLKNISLNNGN